MATNARCDALRLLRVINMTQAHGRTGATVAPLEAAHVAWLEPGSHRYDEALWYLLLEGALTADGCAPDIAAGRPFGHASYELTSRAIRSLETS